MRFLFDCGVLPDAVLDTITLQLEELSEHRLMDLDDALALLSGPLRRRVSAVLAHRRPSLFWRTARPV